MLRKLLRVLGIVLAAAIVIGAGAALYLEPYVTYDRDGAHLSLKKNAQDPDGTGATAALPEVSDAQIVYDEAQPARTGSPTSAACMSRRRCCATPRPCARRSSSRGPVPFCCSSRARSAIFTIPAPSTARSWPDVDTAAVDSLIDWLSQHGYYLIAEVPAFCDTAFALANSAAALPLSSGALWMDSNGCYWAPTPRARP